MQRIGFVGLGHMGYPMVRNLLRAGYEVTVFDIVPEAIQRLVKEGAIAARSIKEVASNQTAIITMLQTGSQVRSVCTSSEGMFAHAQPNTLFIDMSSIDVETSRELHQTAHQRQMRMLDAPVSGGVAGAEAATLTIMVGGKQDVFMSAKPCLEKLGKKIIYAGDAGNGQVAKICNNLILGVSMIAVSEAFALAEQLGLPAKTLFEISSQASGQCWAMTQYVPVPDILPNVPTNRNYQPGFTAKMMLKDLQLSQQAATSVKAATPLGAAATALYSLFVKQDNAELDFSAIYRFLKGVE